MSGKKLLVISDSHGHISVLAKIFKWAKNQMPPDGTICGCAFLGDGFIDLQEASEMSGFYSDWKLVRGNNDYDINLPDAAVFDFSDHRFFICHGNKHSIYGGHYMLLAAAKTNNADGILFGHSHVPFCKNTDGILIVNPGSVGQPRSRIGATFAVIECAEGEPLKAEFFGISRQGSINKIKV